MLYIWTLRLIPLNVQRHNSTCRYVYMLHVHTHACRGSFHVYMHVPSYIRTCMCVPMYIILSNLLVYSQRSMGGFLIATGIVTTGYDKCTHFSHVIHSL